MKYAWLLLVLAGCASAPPGDADMARYSAACEKLGVQKDKAAWGDCIKDQEMKDSPTRRRF